MCSTGLPADQSVVALNVLEEVGGLGLGTLSNRGRHCESAIGGGEFSVAGYVDPPAAGRYSALAN